MRRIFLTAVLFIAMAASALIFMDGKKEYPAGPLILGRPYLLPGGALMTYPDNKDFIDPYFATKALLLAQDNGFDISYLGERWIQWLLPRQEASGLFSRFCYTEEQQYHACAVADADDALLALWIEILYRMAPAGGLPKDWQKSAGRAEAQLESLYDATSGIYLISKAMPVGLLMDNVEIYAAFKNIAANAGRVGDGDRARVFNHKAVRLRKAIIKTFWDAQTRTLKPSTQPSSARRFYPDVVAQVFPLLYGLHVPLGKTGSYGRRKQVYKFYRQWLNHHRASWFETLGKEYPWGLLAVIAAQQGDIKTNRAWLRQTTPYRNINYWNIFDEVAFQVVRQKLREK